MTHSPQELFDAVYQRVTAQRFDNDNGNDIRATREGHAMAAVAPTLAIARALRRPLGRSASQTCSNHPHHRERLMNGHHAAPEDADRCPGCGSIAGNGILICRPIGVDVTEPGYRYLADTWGFCRFLGRHIATSETPWMVIRLAEARREGAVTALTEAAKEAPWTGSIPMWLRSLADRIADDQRSSQQQATRAPTLS